MPIQIQDPEGLAGDDHLTVQAVEPLAELPQRDGHPTGSLFSPSSYCAHWGF
ncbi:hypothetical protein [Malikia sp.]|uniref:hypothetical protein n=1 Tax=Malikia sp. TaxID=2070706 RepID=UPI002631DB66|nr:hypothetical protein [Malikia sp.]MDD2729313.1 hypothetical protein [Malikia sp.]